MRVTTTFCCEPVAVDVAVAAPPVTRMVPGVDAVIRSVVVVALVGEVGLDTLGVVGAAAGVTLAEAVEVGPVPTALVAVTVNVVVVLLVSPVTVADSGPKVWVAVKLPGVETIE